MERKDLLKSPEYWTTKIRHELYACAVRFMQEKGYNRTQLAEYLGVSKGYVSQLLSMEFDHRLSKLVELAIAFGYVPDISFEPVAEMLVRDTQDYELTKWSYKADIFRTANRTPKVTAAFDTCEQESPDMENIKYCA